MYSIIIGSILLSVLHAAIPNHWLPIIAIGKREQWTTAEVINVTIVAALAHACSTIVIGVLLGLLGKEIANRISTFTHFIAPVIFIMLGLLFIYKHHTHDHLHLQDAVKKRSKKRIVIALVIAMFFSPCMEIEAYFLLAGTQSVWLVAFIALSYLVITTIGMAGVAWFAYTGLLKMNQHIMERYAGIITGATLIITGILSFFIF